MAEQAAVPGGGMVRIEGREQRRRLRIEHEAQQEENNQNPPVAATLTSHAGNVTTVRPCRALDGPFLGIGHWRHGH